jgi:hypothetical protein
MYKALDTRSNTEIIILDPEWSQAIPRLRELDHQDLLVCQGCMQPVRVRAGERYRTHFAHKHLQNCDYVAESPVLRNARAVLYEWLVSKFGAAVTIEKKVETLNLFRPVDCWVEHESQVFAYWIFDSRLKSEKRWALRECAAKLGVHFNWIFVSEMLTAEKDNPEHLVLSTTERDFLRQSKYDLIQVNRYMMSGSLHYLDANNHTLTTFRRLYEVHAPQVYKGENVTSQLDKLMVSPKNGEFVHAEEAERLQRFQESRTGNRWEDYISSKNLFSPKIESVTDTKIPTTENSQLKYQSPSSQPPHVSLLSKSYECVFCGQVTDDWLSYDGKTGKCECRSCVEKMNPKATPPA